MDEKVHTGLYKIIGPRKISKFIEKLVRPYVIPCDLEAAYAQMAKDEMRETEAIKWVETTVIELRDK